MQLLSVGHQDCVLERKQIFFLFLLRLGVFWASQIHMGWADPGPLNRYSGCECFVGESRVWGVTTGQGPAGEEGGRRAGGNPGWGLPSVEPGWASAKGMEPTLPLLPFTASSLMRLGVEHRLGWGATCGQPDLLWGLLPGLRWLESGSRYGILICVKTCDVFHKRQRSASAGDVHHIVRGFREGIQRPAGSSAVPSVGSFCLG